MKRKRPPTTDDSAVIGPKNKAVLRSKNKTTSTKQKTTKTKPTSGQSSTNINVCKVRTNRNTTRNLGKPYPKNKQVKGKAVRGPSSQKVVPSTSTGVDDTLMSDIDTSENEVSDSPEGITDSTDEESSEEDQPMSSILNKHASFVAGNNGMGGATTAGCPHVHFNAN